MVQQDYRAFFERLQAQNQFVIHYDPDAMRSAVDGEGIDARALARRVVIVGGTNGKGSIASLIHACAVGAGLRVGLFTSPHLVSFRERMRVNGAPITETDVLAHGRDLFVRYGDPETHEGTRPLSYFELLTILAFRYFAASSLDLLVLEVGLGGRLDASNVIDADLAVFGSVSLDHTSMLGDSVEAIAAEKAAIARVGQPAVMHVENGGAHVLRAALNRVGAELVQVGTEGSSETVRGINQALAESAFRAVALDLGVDSATIDRALVSGARSVRWPGRQSVVASGGRKVYLDGAHNVESAREAERWLGRVAAPKMPVIIGFSGDRDPVSVSAPLASRASRWVVVRATSGNAQEPADVARVLRDEGYRDVEVASDVDVALHSLLPHQDCLVIGSLYLVGDAYASLGFGEAHVPPVLSDAD